MSEAKIREELEEVNAGISAAIRGGTRVNLKTLYARKDQLEGRLRRLQAGKGIKKVRFASRVTK